MDVRHCLILLIAMESVTAGRLILPGGRLRRIPGLQWAVAKGCGVCLPINSPVCGSDGQVYQNECSLRRTDCISRISNRRSLDLVTKPMSFCDSIRDFSIDDDDRMSDEHSNEDGIHQGTYRTVWIEYGQEPNEDGGMSGCWCTFNGERTIVWAKSCYEQLDRITRQYHDCTEDKDFSKSTYEEYRQKGQIEIMHG